MNKFIKTLIIINGLLIPGLVVIMLTAFFWDDIVGNNYRNDSNRVITNNVVIEDQDTLLLQGLRYSSPKQISNSSNYYIEVSPKTYRNPQSARMFSKSSNFESGNTDGGDDLLNILFLDKNFNPLRKLIDKKAYIAESTIEKRSWDSPDSTINNILYTIAFDDSNKDSFLDYRDNSDLYISDLDGDNFIKITNEIDINEFEIINSGKDVFISYYRRIDTQEEYKILRFALYNIASKQFKYLDKIDTAIDDLRTILIDK